MNEKSRLADVMSYNLFDTPPEAELDEITELASLICGTPISLITILDDRRQWFKSKKGLSTSETDINDSFCQHTLHNPDEVLVVNDALDDPRFKNSKLVLGDPHIRFYAGAPLVTKQRHVLGTLCIIDRKPREITDEQKQALQILAKKVMDHIELQKTILNQHSTIKLNTQRLIKITENIPLGIFELRVNSEGNMNFVFLSKGMKRLHPHLELDEWLKDPTIGFSLMHPDDIEPLKLSLQNSIVNHVDLYHEYRVKDESGFHWHAMSGKPERAENGETVIYGSFTDVTHHFEYEAVLEQIAFDISHVLRSPITSMLGITNLLGTEKKLSEKRIREYSKYIQIVATEMEEFTRSLNAIYLEKSKKVTNYTPQ
ncbi:GAF domain-containing protein [Tunicatimonas pelagia]|uniref:GAF domain-containing protein n=1 Tax=Tunicatimonas pelagia TaxID=931531 RepID=UPI002665944E|nr:GAF domain-containing protein [Tunicatimonas pelagia]WKN46300.1 GAF domain-containing protein [Tunicatimonas pelagia]